MSKADSNILVKSPIIKPEDLTIERLRSLSSESFPMWCLTNNVVVDSNKFDFEKHRYLLPIYADNSDYIVVVKAAQLGLTIYTLLRLLHFLETNQGRKAAIYFPTRDGADNLSQDRLHPIIQSCPSVASIYKEGSKLSLRKIGESSLYINHLGGSASKDSVPLDMLVFDEVRLCSLKDIDQARERISHSPYRKQIAVSTCFSLDQKILVRRKARSRTVSTPVERLSLRELQTCWQSYDAATMTLNMKNERVMGFRPITAFHNNGKKKVLRVTFDDNSVVFCTPEHEFAWYHGSATMNKSYIKFSPLKDIINSNYITKTATYIRRDSLVCLRDASKPSPHLEEGLPYSLATYFMLGAYAAEGSCRYDGRLMSVAQLAGKPIYEKAIQWATDMGFSYNLQPSSVIISLASCPDLADLINDFGHTSQTKTVPNRLLNKSNTRQLKAFLEGYIAGDGCKRSSTMWEATTTSPELRDAIKYIALRTGVPAYHREKVLSDHYGDRTYYPIGCSVGSTRLLQNTINSTWRLAKIVAVEEVDEELEVADITVKDTHSYILENGMLVHNCGKPQDTIHKMFMAGNQLTFRVKCGCFTSDTEIVVRKKGTAHPVRLSFGQLKDVWRDYDALCMSRNRELQYKPITAFHENGIRAVEEFQLRNGTTVHCTSDHVIFRRNRLNYTMEQKIGEIDINNSYENSLYVASLFPSSVKCSQAPFDNDTLFILGAFVAEGSWKTDNTINISQKPGKRIWHQTQSWAKHNNLSYKASTKDANGVTVGLFSRPDLIELFNKCGNSCNNKQFPEELLNSASPEQLKQLLYGYLHGDGHFIKRTKDKRGFSCNTAWSLSSTSHKLIEQLSFICLRLGTPVYKSLCTPREGRLPAWTLQFNPKSTFATNLIAPSVSTVSIKAKRELESQEVFDITVAENHNYVLSNGLIVHNCSDGADLARQWPDCVVERPEKGELYLRCTKCGHRLNDTQNGRYIPMNPGADYNSYHMCQLHSKYISLKEIWRAYKTTSNMAEFYNAKLGLPFIDEDNRGIAPEKLESLIDENLLWGFEDPKLKNSKTAMGVDVGADYAYVTIMDVDPANSSRKRIRHIEVIERRNKRYYDAEGNPQNCFVRIRELMKEFNVGLAVIDQAPNYDQVLDMAKDMPGKVYAANFTKGGKNVVEWGDRTYVSEGVKKSGKYKNKYHVNINRFLGLQAMYAELNNADIIFPNRNKLRQVMRNETTGMFEPILTIERWFDMLPRHYKVWKVTNEEEGTGSWTWEYSGGDPHASFSLAYANVALERLRRQAIFTFA